MTKGAGREKEICPPHYALDCDSREERGMACAIVVGEGRWIQGNVDIATNVGPGLCASLCGKSISTSNNGFGFVAKD